MKNDIFYLGELRKKDEEIERLKAEVVELKKINGDVSETLSAIRKRDTITITTETKTWMDAEEKVKELRSQLKKEKEHFDYSEELRERNEDNDRNTIKQLDSENDRLKIKIAELRKKYKNCQDSSWKEYVKLNEQQDELQSQLKAIREKASEDAIFSIIDDRIIYTVAKSLSKEISEAILKGEE